MRDETAAKILKTLQDAGCALSQREICKRSGQSWNAMKKSLRQLRKEGKLAKITTNYAVFWQWKG